MFNLLSAGYRLAHVCQDDPDGTGLKVLDLTLYTTVTMTFRNPLGVDVTVTASRTGTPTDGQIFYVTPPAFFGTLPGLWKFRAYAYSDPTHYFYGDWVSFDVGE